jgi:translation initiation factor 1 (eIF-1/SUI1)
VLIRVAHDNDCEINIHFNADKSEGYTYNTIIEQMDALQLLMLTAASDLAKPFAGNAGVSAAQAWLYGNR